MYKCWPSLVPWNAPSPLVAALAPLAPRLGQEGCLVVLAGEGGQAVPAPLVALTLPILLSQPVGLAPATPLHGMSGPSTPIQQVRGAGRDTGLHRVTTLGLPANGTARQAEAILVAVVEQSAEVGRQGEGDERPLDPPTGKAAGQDELPALSHDSSSTLGSWEPLANELALSAHVLPGARGDKGGDPQPLATGEGEYEDGGGVGEVGVTSSDDHVLIRGDGRV